MHASLQQSFQSHSNAFGLVLPTLRGCQDPIWKNLIGSNSVGVLNPNSKKWDWGWQWQDRYPVSTPIPKHGIEVGIGSMVPSLNPNSKKWDRVQLRGSSVFKEIEEGNFRQETLGTDPLLVCRYPIFAPLDRVLPADPCATASAGLICRLQLPTLIQLQHLVKRLRAATYSLLPKN